MTVTETDQSSDLREAGQRPGVEEYAEIPDFNVGDKVHLVDSNGLRQGPFVVASVNTSSKTYTLESDTGDAVNNGEEVKKENLQAL